MLEVKLLAIIFNTKDITIIRYHKRFCIIFFLCIIDIYSTYSFGFFCVVIVTPEDLITIKNTCLVSLMRDVQGTIILFYCERMGS